MPKEIQESKYSNYGGHRIQESKRDVEQPNTSHLTTANTVIRAKEKQIGN